MRQLWATLRHRPAPLVGTFVALVAASTLVTWAFSLGVAGSATRLPVGRLAGATVVVTGHPDVDLASGRGPTATGQEVPLAAGRPVPASLAARLGTVAGVRAAVADRSVPVGLALSDGRTVSGPPGGPLTGHGWPSAVLTPFHLVAGHAPAGPRQVVVGAGVARRAGLAPGGRVRLAGRRLPPFTVVGVVAAPGGDRAAGRPVFFTGPEAARLSGSPGRADLIGVVGEPGVGPAALAARVRAALPAGRYDVVTGRGRAAVEDPAARAELATLSALGGSAGTALVLVSLFVVASTVALSVGERARGLALVRAVGATPGQVRRSVMAELAALGLAAGLVGFLPGLGLARVAVAGLVAHGLAPAGTQPWTGPLALLPPVVAGVVVAEISGLLSARRASRVHPAAALREASVERRSPRPLRLLLGLAAVAGGVVLSVVVLRQPDVSQQVQEAQLVLLAFMGGIAFLGPYLAAAVELVVRLPLRLAGGIPGRLAAAEIRARSRRMGAALVAIALPVAFAGAIVVIDATALHGTVLQGRQRLAAGAVVAAPAPGFGPSVVGAVRARPGVAAAVGLEPTTVYLQGGVEQSAAAEAVTPGPLDRVLHLGVVSGGLAGFGPGDVALSNLVAGRGGLGARVGDEVTVFLADGTPYRARVTAVFDRSLGFGDVLVPAGAAGGGHLGGSGPGEVLVSGDAGVGPPALARAVAPLAARYPGLRVAGRRVVNARSARLTAQTSYVNDLLLWLVGALAAVALVDTLAVTGLQRREELVLLRRVGATARQILGATSWQAAVVAVAGLVLGAGAAAVAAAVVSRDLTGSWTPCVSGGAVAVVVGLVAGLTAVATLVPTMGVLWRAGSGDGS